jgi:hypothetical protein
LLTVETHGLAKSIFIHPIHVYDWMKDKASISSE